MSFIKVTAIKADQENETYINVERIVSVGVIKLTLPVPGTGGEDKEPDMEERTMTAINMDGAPAILVKETPDNILQDMGE